MLAIEEHQVGYTMPASAKLIGCHEKTVYYLAKEGRLETYRGLDNKMMVSREELYHFIRNSEYPR